jgi:hypothetical protein
MIQCNEPTTVPLFVLTPKQFVLEKSTTALQHVLIIYKLLPPFQNIRCLRLVKQMYLDIF